MKTRPGLLDPDMVRRLDGFYLVLLATAEHTVLPEIYEFFGDRAIDFVQHFEGRTIQIPTRAKIEGAIRDVCLYVDLSKARTKEAVKTVAKSYRMRVPEARKTYQRVRDQIKGGRLEV